MGRIPSMKVSPTRTAHVLFALALLAALGGALLPSVALASVAGTLVTLLATAYAHAARLGRLARRSRLAFSWSIDPSHASGRQNVTEGGPITLHAEFRQQGTSPWRLRDLLPIGAPELRAAAHPETLVPALGRSEFTLSLLPLAAGRHVLLGLRAFLSGPLGLFEVPLYFPFPLRLSVAPRPRPLPSQRLLPAGFPVVQHGRNLRHQRGTGLELRELRDMQAGDPFHAIAWKPSARLGRWIVREVQHEVQHTRWLVLDVSGPMRDAPPGERRLDVALGMAATAIDRWHAEGDRVGLALFEGRLLDCFPPDDRPGHMRRLRAALLDAVHTVDEETSTVDDETVAAIVLRHLRLHDGLSLASRRPGTALSTAVARLALRAEPAVAQEAERVRAPRPEGRLLRAFCRLRGLPLPWRPEVPAAAHRAALTEVFARIARHPARPDTILLLAPAESEPPDETLLRTLALLRRRGTQLSVLLLPSRPSVPQASPLHETLLAVYRLEERRRLRENARLLARAGATPRFVHVPTAHSSRSPS